MDNLERFTAQVRNYLLFLLLISNSFVIAGWWISTELLDIDKVLLLSCLVAGAVFLSILLAVAGSKYLSSPIKIISQAIMHVSPDTANVPAPDQKGTTLGVELVGNLVSHVYQLASVVEHVGESAPRPVRDLKTDFVANSLPLPLIILDKEQVILFANQAAANYLDKPADELVGQNVYSVMDMSFASSNTFDTWLNSAKAKKAVASKTWERVRLTLPESKTSLQFDLAAYYNKNNPEGFETMLVLFDHTAQYGRDDQALGFVALAVHELRSPVTLLRGYIEAVEDELEGNLDPELAGFIKKMKASAQKLSSFINNILDVARIESDQLTLKLHEEKWPEILNAAIEESSLRARVHGIELQTQIADNLPAVGVDRTSIAEVIGNLIDNAIKYSGQSKKIIIRSNLAKDGLVETTIQDFGVGIPVSLMPNLFEKFYRSHRSKEHVGGTGLGLYLSKTIVEAHGGNIWVQSKEGQGSVFGFTVVPYSQLAEAQKTGDNKDIVRGAHGWIKNHSLYRG